MAFDFHNEVIEIGSISEMKDRGSWRLDPQYDGIYPEGAREKEIYFSPEMPLIDFIKPNWRYLFKLSRSMDWCPWQFWNEIIAYRLGAVIGVEVPPAHVGYHQFYWEEGGERNKSVYGALIEWFYGEDQMYIPGGRIMSTVIANFDIEKGEQHNFHSIMEFFEGFDLDHWAKVFTLDSLIGNTDRHQDNWGIILDKGIGEARNMKYSPAFDNGTAMEYGIQEERFSLFLQKPKLDAQICNAKRAKHHMKWALDEDVLLNYYEFMKRFVLKYPETKGTILQCLGFTRRQTEEILAPLCDVVEDPTFALSPERLVFILDMIFHRKNLLERALAE